ncbi:MAG: AAA family ATPase [Nannocystaceae bacterium]
MPGLILIAGPCGVGKSTVSELIAKKTGLTHVDLDAARRKHGSSDRAFRHTCFNLLACVPKLAPDGRAVIDVGGDTMFRTGAASLKSLDCYRDQVEKLKATSGCAVVVLDAPKAVLRDRFESAKPNRAEWFDAGLASWATAKPYWDGLADVTISTDGLDSSKVCAAIMAQLGQP